MRRPVALTTLLWAFHLSVNAAVLVSWNFNSSTPDNDPATGITLPALGEGELSFIGGSTNLLGEVGGGSPSDREVNDDTQMRITRPPAQGTNNKGAGIQIQFSSQGFKKLRLSWAQYNSATASRYWRVLFGTDAVNWTEHSVITQTNSSVWLQHAVILPESRTDSGSVFIRIVSEFESTATGTGGDEYRAVSDDSNYSTAGSWWIDSLTVSIEPSFATVFVYWNFNSPESDGAPETGSINPISGAGELRVIGITSQTFGSVGQGRTSDTEEIDNSMLRLSGFPPEGTADKSAGIEMVASTVGLRRVGLMWDQYNSATANRHLAVQYTTNGADFVDHVTVSNTSSSTWIRARKVSFENVLGAENNPNFGVRLVSTFGPSGTYEAVGSSSSYGTTGTLWLDMVTLTGEPITTNSAPVLTCSLMGGELVLSWPGDIADFIPEFSVDLDVGWSDVDQIPEQIDGSWQVRVLLENKRQFFRLRR
jgi:hypothetical protein